MSFPPRNIMTGVHMGPGVLPGHHYMGMGGGMVPPPTVGFMPQMMPPMPAIPGRGPPQYRGAPDGTVAQRGPQPPTRRDPQGPPVTVFVGNITERAPDIMVRHVLNACGPVISWKRVQGASGRLQAFGFCEFANPDAGLRAIRLLHDYEIADKKLVVKVDAKTQTVLDEFKDKIRKSRAEGQQNGEGETDFLDEGMKAFDKSAYRRIQTVIQEHSQEMNNFQNPLNKQARERKLNKQSEKLLAARENDSSILEKPADLEDVEMEGDKKELISREIGKFREIMKRQEEQREAERRQREERDRERRERDSRESSQPNLPPRSITRSRSRSRSYSPPEGSYTNKIRARVERRRSRSRSVEALRKSEADLLREREEEQERKEKKKLERKAQEKEAAYQERLRAWETRERKKGREFERERAKEREKRLEMEREARRLKEFLEDYEDERDDPKYYKGRELHRRLAEREREKDQDERDRQREREEMMEIKQRLLQQGHPDPYGEFERIRQEREELYQPRFLIRPEESQRGVQPPDHTEDISQSSLPSVHDGGPMPLWVQPPDSSPLQRDSPMPDFSFKPVFIKAPVTQPPPPEVVSEDHGVDFPAPPVRPQSPPPPSTETVTPSPALQPSDTDGERTMSPKFTPISHYQPEPPAPPPPPPPPATTAVVTEQPTASKSSKKKKLDIKDVFNTEEDEEVEHKRKRKLPSLPANQPEGEEKRSQEEKRKHIKSIISRIPTDKQELFNYCIHWDAVDSSLMERRIRPWINKKIVEYIGEPEPTLVDFICSKVMAGSSPTSILADVQMVLDEEAEVFVVKMWRLLIYEIEAKKIGLVK